MSSSRLLPLICWRCDFFPLLRPFSWRGHGGLVLLFFFLEDKELSGETLSCFAPKGIPPAHFVSKVSFQSSIVDTAARACSLADSHTWWRFSLRVPTHWANFESYSGNFFTIPLNSALMLSATITWPHASYRSLVICFAYRQTAAVFSFCFASQNSSSTFSPVSSYVSIGQINAFSNQHRIIPCLHTPSVESVMM